MNKHKIALKALEQLIEKIEIDMKRARYMINEISEGNCNIEKMSNDQEFWELATKLLNYEEENAIKVIEWIYDWYFMNWSDEKKYPVPMNYASKTKLIPWDVLKLKIMEDWKLVYKLIWAASKKYIKWTLSKTDDNKFVAISDEWHTYLLNQAAVTFFKWKPGDEMSIIINWDKEYDYAAIETIIPSTY